MILCPFCDAGTPVDSPYKLLTEHIWDFGDDGIYVQLSCSHCGFIGNPIKSPHSSKEYMVVNKLKKFIEDSKNDLVKLEEPTKVGVEAED